MQEINFAVLSDPLKNFENSVCKILINVCVSMACYTVYGRSKVWSSERRNLAALFSQSQPSGKVTWPRSLNDVTDQLLHPPSADKVSWRGVECQSVSFIYYVKKTRMFICVAFSYIFYSEITSNQMFFFILEQYVGICKRFILPIVIDCICFGGRRIRAAQTLLLH